MTNSTSLTRRRFLGAGAAAAAAAQAAPSRPPNFVLIYADDLGYGDLGVFGHPTVRTPNLDRMAAEGVKFTNFYSAAPLCTPSRAALLTGRYPVRSGLVRVLFPGEEFGMPDSEVTLAEALRGRGYATGCIGKWHLGDLPPYRPNRHGFDYYYGLHYSNDMDARHLPGRPWPPLTLYRNEEVVESPVTQETITSHYTAEAVDFISRNRKRPFFLYLPHNMPHWPWFASEKFRGKSQRGVYGDAVEEVDWGVGEVLRALRAHRLEDNTLVIFTSDNGGTAARQGGSNGLLRGGKGSTWEGGMREPFVARWPGRIPAGSLRSGIASTMDLYTTLIETAGGKVPSDRPVDGLNILPMLEGSGPSPRNEFFYYRANAQCASILEAVRSGDWKLRFKASDAARPAFEPDSLYHLGRDPSERTDEAAANPEVVARLTAAARRFHAEMRPGKPCPPLAERYRKRSAAARRSDTGG